MYSGDFISGIRIPEIKSPDYMKILIRWTVTPSLVEAFHAALYSLPHQSYWVASLARRLTGLVQSSSCVHVVLPRWLTAVPETPNHFVVVGYPGYLLLLGKP